MHYNLNLVYPVDSKEVDKLEEKLRFENTGIIIPIWSHIEFEKTKILTIRIPLDTPMDVHRFFPSPTEGGKTTTHNMVIAELFEEPLMFTSNAELVISPQLPDVIGGKLELRIEDNDVLYFLRHRELIKPWQSISEYLLTLSIEYQKDYFGHVICDLIYSDCKDLNSAGSGDLVVVFGDLVEPYLKDYVMALLYSGHVNLRAIEGYVESRVQAGVHLNRL